MFYWEKAGSSDERELEDIAAANAQPLPAYFGMSMMFPHIHPLARAAQNYYQEANACIGIMAYLDRVADPLVRHEHLSQRDEELMHFMEGKFQIDFLCATPETQQPVEEALGYLLHQIGGMPVKVRRRGDPCHRDCFVAGAMKCADRLRDLQFLRPVPRGLSRIGDPADAAGAAPPLRGAAGQMHRLRRMPRLLPRPRRSGAIRDIPRHCEER